MHGAVNYQIIVVDNGSSDGTWEYLQSLQPDIRSLRNPRNMFFARGCNRGAWAATAENIVFLNNDTIVTPNWLDELVRPLLDDATIGITGNKQLFPDYRVWHAGTVVGQDRLPWHVCYGFDRTHPAVNMSRDCASVSGCCLAIRRDLFRRLRGFDPHFENGFEMQTCACGLVPSDIEPSTRREAKSFIWCRKHQAVLIAKTRIAKSSKPDGWISSFPTSANLLDAAGFLGRSNDSALRIGFIAASAECCLVIESCTGLDEVVHCRLHLSSWRVWFDRRCAGCSRHSVLGSGGTMVLPVAAVVHNAGPRPDSHFTSTLPFFLRHFWS